MGVFYSPSNIRELNLNEWPDPPNPVQCRALIAALKYNDWFTSLVAKGPSMKREKNREEKRIK